MRRLLPWNRLVLAELLGGAGPLRKGVMSMAWNRQRTYAMLLALGVCVLLFRTIVMLTDGSLTTLVVWASALLVLEFLLDAATLLSMARWWVDGTEAHARFSLRTGTGAAILHAVRLLIPCLAASARGSTSIAGRRFEASPRRNGLAIFAAVLCVLGLLGVLIIWRHRCRGASGCTKVKRQGQTPRMGVGSLNQVSLQPVAGG